MVSRSLSEIMFKLIGIVIIAGSIFGAWLAMDYHNFVDQPLTFEDKGINYQVGPGATLTSIARDLEQRGIIDNASYLMWLGRLSGTADTIKAGEYRFNDGLTPERLLQQIVNGDIVEYAITIVEGWSFHQLMDAVHSNEFLLHTLSDYSDREIMQKIGHRGEHPEGRFLPDTYHFPRLTTDIAFLQRAYNAMQVLVDSNWTSRDPELAVKSPYEAIILASIVEKETALASERKQIAGIFNRRLMKRMRLQTDPTVIYGLGRAFDGNIRRRDLRKDTPYNTYLHKGLPPTPIAMPGRAAILAVLDPGPGEGLYFVSRGDGSHQFSVTLKEHNAAVVKYQLDGQRRPFSSSK